MKKLVIIFAVLLALFCMSCTGFAQKKNKGINIEKIDEYGQFSTNLNNEDLLSQSVVIQVGDDNEIFLKQVGHNVATLRQVGNFNAINLIQSGNEGQFTLYQHGELNRYKGELYGSNIEVLITQNGNLNTINQQVSGDHSLSEIIQVGHYNTFTQIMNRLNTPHLKIMQRGNDMRLIIKSN